MLTCSRRTFIQSILSVPALGLTSNFFPALAADQKHQMIVVGGSDTANLFDLSSFKLHSINIGFPAHSFVQAPKNPMRFLGLEKHGKSAAAVDFSTKQVKNFTSGPDFVFYGHGIYVEKQNAFFVGRVNQITGHGHLTGYDCDTCEIVSDHQVTIGSFHECRRAPDGTIIVTSSGIVAANYASPNGGERQAATSLIKIDPKTCKVLGEIPVADFGGSVGHFHVTREGQLIALSSTRPSRSTSAEQHVYEHGYIFYSPDLNGPLRRLEWPDQSTQPTVGEMLSVALSPDHKYAAVTCPSSKTVTLVDMQHGKILNTYPSITHWVVYDTQRQSFCGVGDNEREELMAYGPLTEPHSSMIPTSYFRQIFHSSNHNWLSGAHAISFDIPV